MQTGEDRHGLVCGFHLGDSETAETHEPLADLGPIQPGARPRWLHFNVADARARRWLQDESGLPDEAIEVLTDLDPRVQVSRVGAGLVAVLTDIHHDFGTDPEGFGKIRVYLDDDHMVSARADRLRTADRVRRKLLSGWKAGSPWALFEHFVETLVMTFAEEVNKLADTIDTAEDEILAGRYQSQAAVLGRVRRTSARLRRHLNANRAALVALRNHLPPPLAGDDHRDLREAIDRFDGQELESLQERTRLLQEEIGSRVSEATNRSLFLLSMISAALLPITLITGIFGMNVGGLPFSSHPHGFVWVMLGMMGAVLGAVIWIRGRRRDS